jgi:hypothetical protein
MRAMVGARVDNAGEPLAPGAARLGMGYL